ncbi:hypothetical protein Syun_002036 [Stephania yunnanensis]|uniref:Putative zinc-finger domain-containing protein n=1 Tax=Stephania yunnanensis TaxID=152371 RepID=A0AAP0LF18_9MAGN
MAYAFSYTSAYLRNFLNDTLPRKPVSRNDPCNGAVHPKTSFNSFPSKPVGHHAAGWYGPSIADRNLVISFSDDDSGSDSEECLKQRVSERGGNRFNRDEFKRAGSSQLESEYLQGSTGSQIKRMPDKLPIGRSGISSMGKIHGSSSRSIGPPLVEQVPDRIQRPDSLNKTSPNFEQGFNQISDRGKSKLENLRQEIAIRENELKLQLQSMQKSGKTNSGFRQNRGLNEKNVVLKKSRSPSVDTQNFEHEEPEAKRMRPDESCQRNLHIDQQQRVLGPATKLEKNARKQHRNVDHQISVLPDNLAVKEKYPESSLPLLEDATCKINLPIKQRIHGASGADISSSSDQSNRSLTASLMIPSNVLSQSSWAMKVTSTADVETRNQVKMPSSKETNVDGLKLSDTIEDHHYPSSTDKSTDPQNECGAVVPDDGRHNLSNDMVCNYLAHVPENSFGASDASNLCIPLELFDQFNFLGHKSIDIESLMKLEDTQDRELEEAQEHRRRCEQEENKARRAYREAQRALVEANARCAYLYRRRELFSAKLRAFMMDDSSAQRSSRWKKHIDAEVSSLDDVLHAAVDPISSLGQQLLADDEVLNHLGGGPSIQGRDSLVLHGSYQHIEREKVMPEPCNKGDSIIFGLSSNKETGVPDGACSPFHQANMSGDEDDGMPLLDNRTAPLKSLSEDEENFRESEPTINEKPGVQSSTAGAKDYALLEASLRSKLFAKLGTRSMTKYAQVNTGEGLTSNKCSHDQMEEARLHISKTNEQYEMNGQNKPAAKTKMKALVQSSSRGLRALFIWKRKACCSAASASSVPSSSIKTAVGLITSIFCGDCRTQAPCKSETSHEEDAIKGCSDFFGFLDERLIFCYQGGTQGEMGSYTCDLSVDPFWPLCMFEVRGKCNDEECQWQHVKDYSERNIKHHLHATNADSNTVSSTNPEKFSSAHKLSSFHWECNISAPPTYLVGLDLVKPELHASTSVFARAVGLCLRKGFSTSSGVPFSVQKNILQEEPFFHDSDGRFWSLGSWTRHSSYFQSQDVAMKHRHGSADPEQILEVAISLINEEFNKLEGKKKVLFKLSRALEGCPTSVLLWVFYLYFYYCNEKSVGKDDMFSLAVHCNEGSYELWLMYINSRVHIDDRLLAYELALSALCQHACTSDWDRVYGSACILDLFMQMMDFLFMSGNSGKAIRRISGLFSVATDVSEHGSVLLSDVLVHLTLSDKCIFWICCVYLMIYRKLPDKYVNQFEFEKELFFEIEWPPAQLTAEEKNEALKLMKMGVESVSLGFNAHEAPKLFHVLAVNHFKCVAMLEGIECCKDLLNKYIIQYPTCIELLLISARLDVSHNGVLGLQRFRDALSNRPSEAPEIQCIWNQYVQCALEAGETSLAKELMIEWFESFWKVNHPESRKSTDGGDNGLHDQLESCLLSGEGLHVASHPWNDLFGLLNLSLHRLLQKDHIGARLAIDKALAVAAPEDFKHCVKEHATFVLSHLSEPSKDALGSGMIELLNSYLVDARSSQVTELLSRRFCQSIRRPRIRQLINKLLCVRSSEFSLINSILEACYGPFLFPGSFGDAKDLVDFVEPLMELSPGNYRLAISVCDFLTSKSCGFVASTSTVFWATSLLVNSIYQASPVAPEHAWVEVAGTLSKLVEVQDVSERLHQQALLVYPFSMKLWDSYYNLGRATGKLAVVVTAARDRGVRLG